MHSPESELIDLQSRLSFQEDALSSLNEIVARQSTEIHNLQKQLQVLYKKIDDLKYDLEQDSSTPPPHY